MLCRSLRSGLAGPDGLFRVRRRRPATADTGYLWFSMSKIATATAAMRLADERRLDLDAPVRELVPDYMARSGEQPLIRQLLDHTSGAANPLPVRWVLPGL